MLKKVKIIFIDLDGTLLDITHKHSHDISSKNMNALAKAKKEGKHIIISTGRSDMSAEKYLSKIDYTYAVTANGAIILKKQEKIQEIKMNVKTTILIVDFARKNKLIMKLNGERNAFGCFSFLHKSITKKLNFNPKPNFDLDLQKEYHKFVVWGKSRKNMLNIQEKLLKVLDDVSIVSSLGGWTLEITHKDATKGKANAYVAKEFFGITKKEEMLHIGDSMNDSTCLEYMNVVAMKNSTKAFYDLTDLKGPHYKNGGVARVLAGEIVKEIKKTK